MGKIDYRSEEASKYSQISLKGEGTLFLSFRDIDLMIKEHCHNSTFHSLKAIDYGCGAGRSTRYLKSLGISQVEGFDISGDMIQQARGFDPHGNYTVIPSALIPAYNSTYDLAFMSFVTVAIDQKMEISRIFRELNRVLRKGGQVLSLTLSEAFWNPKRKWITYKQDYPENYVPVSGQKSRLTINFVNLELTDYYWQENDIIECAKEAKLSLTKIHRPIGKPEDDIAWQDESNFSPYTIFSFRKI